MPIISSKSHICIWESYISNVYSRSAQGPMEARVLQIAPIPQGEKGACFGDAARFDLPKPHGPGCCGISRIGRGRVLYCQNPDGKGAPKPATSGARGLRTRMLHQVAFLWTGPPALAAPKLCSGFLASRTKARCIWAWKRSAPCRCKVFSDRPLAI